MKGDRRSVVVGLGTTLFTTGTRYLGLGEGSGSNDGDGGLERVANDDADAAPAPTIVERTGPDPTLVRVDDEPAADGRHEFSAEIHNAGTRGTVGMTLVWLDDRGPHSSTEPGPSEERFVEAGERSEIVVTSRVPDGYSAYELRTWVTEIGVAVENNGGPGRVEVRLLEREQPVTTLETVIEAGGTAPLEFEGEYSGSGVDPSELVLETRPVE